MLVTLGIGLPSLVAGFVPAQAGVFFQAENGVIGLGARPPEGMEDPHLTDAGGGFVTAVHERCGVFLGSGRIGMDDLLAAIEAAGD